MARPRPPQTSARATRDAWDAWVDRGRPALAVLASALAPFRDHTSFPPLEAWNAALPAITSAGGARIRFVDQAAKRRARLPYDEQIFTRGEVPSRRDNWHDFFNMLVWATFPETKRAINEAQRAALEARKRPPHDALPRHRRLPEQDALAILDEGGVIVAVRDVDLSDAVAHGAVEPIARAVRDDLARVWVLGHAIYEHLATSAGVVRALVQIVPCPALDPRAADRALADALAASSVRYDRDAIGLSVVDELFVCLAKEKKNSAAAAT